MVDRKNPLIIGLTGSFGSGCSYIAKEILTPKGYQRIALSDILREEHRSKTGQPTENLKRQELQEFGDEIRREHGSKYLANKAIEDIHKSPDTKWIVDSIRNPAEIGALQNYSNRFFLLGIYADRDVRWERTKNVFDDDPREFDRLDKNDKGSNNEKHGQRVEDCFYDADVVLANNEHAEAIGNECFEVLKEKVLQYVDLIEKPRKKTQPLNEREVLMAMAYAASQRSSCLKRKVGAVIVDDLGNVISSGYNEVPREESACAKQYMKCYRTHVLDAFFADLKKLVPDTAEKEVELRERFRGTLKLLDHCRALHAEENAIVTLARNGNSIPLEKCTLYTTTYPCRTCANKIHNVGIKRVVYVEPYPQPEAKVILRKARIRDECFEGVTYRAFFRLYGEQR